MSSLHTFSAARAVTNLDNKLVDGRFDFGDIGLILNFGMQIFQSHTSIGAMIDSYVDSLIDLVRRGLGPIGNGVFGWTTRFLMLLLRFLLRFGLSKRCRLSLASSYGRIEFCRQVSDGLCLLSNELFQSCNLSFQKLTTRACCRGGFCLHRHNLPQNQHPLKYQFQAVNMYYLRSLLKKT